MSKDFLYTNSVSERKGTNILFDLNTPEGGSVKFNNFFNQINTNYFESRADTTLFSNPSYTFDDIETEQKVFLSSIEGSNYLLGFNINWNAAFSESRTNHPFNYSLTFFGKGSAPMPGYTTEFLDHTLDNPTKNFCKEKSVSINFSREYNISDEISGRLKFGGKYRTNSRFYDEYLYAENSSLAGQYQYRKLADGSLQLKDFSGTRFDGLVGLSKLKILYSYFQDNPSDERIIFDKYGIPLIGKDALHLWRQLNYSPYYANDGPDINSYNFSESVFAGYIMHSLNFGQSAKFITGIRIESEQNKYSGYYFPNFMIDKADITDLYNGIPNKTDTYKYNKITVLPNFQMILKPTNFLNLRLAAYKTIIRPDVNTRIPKFFSLYSINYGYLNMGNPDLKNADVWNYEFQTQFYGSDIGMFSINAFYKDIKGMVQTTDGEMMQAYQGIQLSSPYQIDSLGITLSPFPVNLSLLKSNTYYFYTYYNSSKPTHIWGFEIEHQANFRYLPGLLKNITLNYNLAFLRSETWGIDSTEYSHYSNENCFIISPAKAG